VKPLPIAAALLALASASRVSANDDYLAAESVKVVRAEVVPSTAQDPAWDRVEPTAVWVAPQKTVRLNDADANATRDAPPMSVEVRALDDGTRVGLQVSWSDASHNRAGFADTNAFGDSFAIEMPLKFGAGQRLPYVGMGDVEQHVLVSMVRASESNERGMHGHRKGTYVGAGFGSLTRVDLEGIDLDLRYDQAAQRWKAVFVRSRALKDHDIARPLVPFALAIWDGAQNHRSANKYVSRWKVLYDAKRPPEADYLKELSYGYNPGEVGNAAAGKGLVEAVCATCHRFGDKNIAPVQLAPNLSNIGITTTYAYLRDSILNPSQIVVPSINHNRHYSPSGERDRYGAYPNDLNFVWSAEGADGKPVSKMPPFAFPDPQIADMLAYLKSLGKPEQMASIAPGDTQ
jgi:DMSO reductase family type II enzyme heme b subunit